MLSFKEFLTETSGKNVHLEHLEDEVLNLGINGTRSAINFLRSLRDMLAGSAKSHSNVTVKWDGAPAVFCGTDPENGKFFVGTKAVFGKRNPKINYTNADIDKNHPAAGLNYKLKVALRELSKLGIKGIIQGDMMFTKEDVSTKNINGEKLVTFQPNTIMYAVPVGSNLAKDIQAAQMGIVFHTTYSGSSIADAQASFGVNLSGLKKTKRVWVHDAKYADASGTATMTEKETTQVTKILSKAGNLFRTMDSSIVNMIAQDNELRELVKQFNNAKVKRGQPIGNVRAHTREFIAFIKARFEAEIAQKKTERGRSSRQKKLEDILKRIQSNKKQLLIMFEMMNLLKEAKLFIIDKLKRLQRFGTFVPTANGFKVTSPEGFVAIDHLTGNAVKLVDRMEFSRANFTVDKNWTK